MVHTAHTVKMLRVVALLVAVALFMWSVGIPGVNKEVAAASVTSASDTLSDSAPSAASDHTFVFTTPNGLSTGQTFTFTFPGDFTLPTGLDFNDMDLKDDGAEQTLGASAGAGTWGVSTTTTTITFETPTDGTVGSSSIMAVFIGTHASSGATGDSQLVNPSATSSYGIDIGGTMQDSGQVRVAIIENVTVSASVDTTLEFTIAGVANGQSVNGSPTTTSTTTTSTSLPFETLSANVSKTLAQDLTITTNADSGFAVTVYQDANLLSSAGADIDGFIDGAYTDTPTAWISPSADIADEDTWGHWGVTSEDPDIFGNDLWVAASTTPRTVFSHNDVVNASTTRVGYQAQISGLQEAGTDYNTTLTYIATPTF